MELNTHPTGGAYDLLGHMPEIQIEDPIFPVTVRISIRLTARAGTAVSLSFPHSSAVSAAVLQMSLQETFQTH